MRPSIAADNLSFLAGDDAVQRKRLDSGTQNSKLPPECPPTT
jgi:hypothetical protein